MQSAELMDRSMQLNLSIVGGTLYLDNGKDSLALEPILLHAAD